MVGTEYPFRTVKACFLHRMLPKTRRVPQEAFLSTARIFGTREGPLQYRMPTIQPSNHPTIQPSNHPTTQPPSHHSTPGTPSTPSTPVPNAINGKGIACSEFIKLPEKEAIAKAGSGMPPKENPSLTLSPTRKPQMSSLPQKCSGHHP